MGTRHFPQPQQFYVLVGPMQPLPTIVQLVTTAITTIRPIPVMAVMQLLRNTANSPNHISGGFPTDCVTCHGQSQWTPANWDHDDICISRSSVDSTRENGINAVIAIPMPTTTVSLPVSPATIRIRPTVNTTVCQGYQYNSNACYACHPNGED